jgi:glycosyltransferase involved in cell wall biosynthesis
MRVMLVLEACGGGSARHVADLASGLLARDHEVSLVFSPQRAEPWFVETIGSLDRLDVHSLPMDRSVTFSDLTSCRELKRLIDANGPFDLLHGHSSKAGALLRLAQIGNKTPIVYTPHAPITMDPELSLLARTAYLTVERLLAGLCARIICVSPAERDHLQDLGFADQKLRVVCNGIGALPQRERGRIREKMGIDADTVCFGCVGRITHQKAINHALSAFAAVCREINDIRLVIVGDGPDLNTMEQLSADLGISQQVIFTGAANGTELMAGFDIFLLPSRYEGMPYVLLEAAASNLPIIMTDVGGADLVVRDGENGFVVDQGQHDELVDRMLSLARQPELRQNMSAKSAEIAAAFSLDRMISGTLSVYEELISGQ